jgi:predicted nucleic acid-binding protein
MIVLDTNVLSEVMKPSPARAGKLHDVRRPCYKADLDYLWTGQ